jgi:hypothetical protein
MKLKLFPLLALAIMVGLSSCYKDVVPAGGDPTAPPQFVSFNGDLKPMFATNCGISGCHDGVNHKPDLRAENSFGAITSGGFVNVLLPNQSKIYTLIASGEMPPTGALKSTDVQKVLDWIRNGAPNN